MIHKEMTCLTPGRLVIPVGNDPCGIGSSEMSRWRACRLWQSLEGRELDERFIVGFLP